MAGSSTKCVVINELRQTAKIHSPPIWPVAHLARPSRWRHLQPALALAKGGIEALFEPELLDVELERPVLIGDRDADRTQLRDADPAVCVAHSFDPPIVWSSSV